MVDIDDDSKKQCALVKVIRWLSDNVKKTYIVVIQARELYRYQKWFTLSNEKRDIETTIKYLFGEIDITTQEYNDN